MDMGDFHLIGTLVCWAGALVNIGIAIFLVYQGRQRNKRFQKQEAKILDLDRTQVALEVLSGAVNSKKPSPKQLDALLTAHEFLYLNSAGSKYIRGPGGKAS